MEQNVEIVNLNKYLKLIISNKFKTGDTETFKQVTQKSNRSQKFKWLGWDVRKWKVIN